MPLILREQQSLRYLCGDEWRGCGVFDARYEILRPSDVVAAGVAAENTNPGPISVGGVGPEPGAARGNKASTHPSILQLKDAANLRNRLRILVRTVIRGHD